MAGPSFPFYSFPGFIPGSGACDYPTEAHVLDGITFDFGNQTGTLVLPNADDVLDGVPFGPGGTDTGTLRCITPLDPPDPPDRTTSQCSPYASIMQAIMARVSTSLAIVPAYIRLVANDRYKITEAEDFFVYIQAFGPSPFTDGGAGRLARNVSRRVRIYVYTRSGVDSYGGDEIALLSNNPSQTVATPPTYPGHFVAEESVYQYLDDWTPLDSGGDALTIGPLHPIDSSSGPPERPPENDAGLMRSCLDFEVCYVLCQDPAEPPS